MSTQRPEESPTYWNGLDATHFAKTPPRTHKIAKLNHLAYLGFLEWMAADDNHCGLVHAAEIHHPQHGRVEVCVKMFPDSGPGHRGLVNEVTGWLMANLLNIKQPGVAALINVPLAKVKPRKSWLRGLGPNTTHWPAFCCERLHAKSAALEFNNQLSPRLTSELQGWGQLFHTIVLDEQIGNADRHGNNLLRLGPRDFAVIDHDRLACEKGTQDWTAAALDPEKQFDNQLQRRVAGTRGVPAFLVHQLSDLLPLHLHENSGELAYWVNMLVSNPAERKGWMEFIEHRTWLLKDLVHKRFGMLHGNLDDRPDPHKYAARYQHVIPL